MAESINGTLIINQPALSHGTPAPLPRIYLAPGTPGNNGTITFKDEQNIEYVRLGHIGTNATVPGGVLPALAPDYMGLRIRSKAGDIVAQVGKMAALNPDQIAIELGGKHFSGHLSLVDADGHARVQLGAVNGAEGKLTMRTASQKECLTLENGNAWLGGFGADGDLILFDGKTQERTTAQASIHLDGSKAQLTAGGQNTDGILTLKNKSGVPVCQLIANTAWFGAHGASGRVFICSKETLANAWLPLPTIDLNGDNSSITFTHDGDTRVRLDGRNGNLWLGGNHSNGDLFLFDENGDNQEKEQATIHLNGKTGDILLKNADCAEEFDVVDANQAEPGDVMVFAETGALQRCQRGYDPCAAGVLSGAGQYRPGIVLDKQTHSTSRRPLALMGKVYCKVDADHGPVRVGDLLTTSPTPGHAMKAADPRSAFGAVLGKALGRLETGRGLIPMLVTLQ